MYKILMAIVAIIPVLLLMCHVYIKDRHDKEPIGLVLKLFIYGAAACYIAYLGEKYGVKILAEYIDKDSAKFTLIRTFILVALVEEVLKFIFLYAGSWRYKAFNYKYDAIIFAVANSLGFALAENLIYISMYGLKVGVLRGITTVPMHAATAVFLGINYGAAKECASINDHGGKRLLIFSGIVIAILVHGVYNFCLDIESTKSILIFFGIVLLLYIFTLLKIKRYSKKDKPILPEE